MGRIAIICAGGAFPKAIVEACKQENPFLILLKNLASDDLLGFDHKIISIAKIGGMIEAAKAAGCNQVCFIGSLTRPPLFSNIPDLKALALMPRFLKAYAGGDNHLLNALATIFAENGLTLIGAHEIAPQLLAPKGVWGKTQPSPQDERDIATARAMLEAISPFDIGQGVIIHNNHIVAIEGAEGTDGLLRRMKDMRENGRIAWKAPSGLLVKTLKAHQNNRLDMPAVGYNTIKLAIDAGLRGVVVQAGGALVMDIEALTALANHNNMLIMGA